MRLHHVLRWGLALLMGIALTLPAVAKGPKDRDDDDDKSRVRVIVVNNDPGETKAYQQWYGAQVGSYRDIDKETGERIGDLLQLVAEVGRDRIILTDRDNVRHTAMLTGNTKVSFEDNRPGNSGWGHSRAADAAKHLRAGDLVIVQGYLRANGDFTASRIRVMGHTWGWDDDDYTPTPNYGQRAWGEVRAVYTREGRLEIDANIGRRVVQLARDAQVIVNGRTLSLDYLRRGDRVVFYYRDFHRNPLEAYRVVVLGANEKYPDGDRPYCTDPDYQADRPSGPIFEGRLEALSTGVLFNKITLRTVQGRTIEIRAAKTLQAIDVKGERIALYNLRQGESLRVTYSEVGGTFFAQRVEVMGYRR